MHYKNTGSTRKTAQGCPLSPFGGATAVVAFQAASSASGRPPATTHHTTSVHPKHVSVRQILPLGRTSFLASLPGPSRTPVDAEIPICASAPGPIRSSYPRTLEAVKITQKTAREAQKGVARGGEGRGGLQAR